MAHTLKDICAADVRLYLTDTGWVQDVGFKNRNLMVFNRHTGTQTLAIPANRGFDDFYPVLDGTVKRLARLMDKSEQDIIEDIIAAGEAHADDPDRQLEHINDLAPEAAAQAVKQTMSDAADGLREAIDILKKANAAEQEDPAEFWKNEFFSFLASMTTTTHGKQMYFLQEDGKTVYSRVSGSYMTLRDAEKEYLGELADKEGIM